MTTQIAPETPSLATFGGAKRDIRVSATPDGEVSADNWNLLVAQVTSMGHTATRCMARVLVSAGVATLDWHDAVWGDTSGVAPVVVRTGLGVFTVTWATAYDDLQSVPESHSVNLRTIAGLAAYKGATFVDVTASVTAVNVVTVRTFDAAGAAVDPDSFDVSAR